MKQHWCTLGNHRIDLAGHDRGACLPRRNREISESATRAGIEQTEVVGCLLQVHRKILEHGTGFDVGAGVGDGGHGIRGGGDGQVGDFGEHGGGGVAEAKIGTDASADCRGPQIEYAQPFRQRIHGLQVGRQEARPSVYLLTVGHGHRILQLCAADLDIVAMAVCLHVECFTKTLRGLAQGLRPWRMASLQAAG